MSDERIQCLHEASFFEINRYTWILIFFVLKELIVFVRTSIGMVDVSTPAVDAVEVTTQPTCVGVATTDSAVKECRSSNYHGRSFA